MTADPLPRSHLFSLQREGRAAFGEVDGWEMPRVYENIKMEYLAAKGTVAVIDRSQHGRLLVSGAKRFDLLNRLTSNDLRQVGPGQGTHTVLLTDKGRIIDDLKLYAREGDYYLVTSPGNQLQVKEHIEKLRFRDDVTLTDVTEATAMICLHGPQSAHLLEGVTHAHHLAALAPHHHAEVAIGSIRFLAARTTEIGGTGFALIVKGEDAEKVWRTLLTRGDAYGTSPMGEEAYEMVRIEFGVPRFGREITGDHNPLETRLDDAISWTKGCYIGQEVIARLDSRQKVSKLLVGLWLEPGPVPDAGSAIEDPARPGLKIGTLTSVAPSLDHRRVIGLAYVRNDLSAAGTRLVVAAPDDRVGAVVSDLPFRKP